LAEAGIDKRHADRARKLNALSKKNFENLITEGRNDAKACLLGFLKPQ
jgi:hypothetical protein